MNLLRKPIVVALLCLTALGLLLKNVLHLGGNEKLAGSTPGPVIRPLLASVAPVPSPAESSATTVSPPSIERDDHLQSLTNRWMHPGRRDPFGAQYDSQRQAANVLALKGIWRQTGSNLAVINGTVVAQGERIQDFTVEKIEPDRVWVTGPNGREELSFKVHPVELSSRSRQEPQR
jgi:hypothetical protein